MLGRLLGDRSLLLGDRSPVLLLLLASHLAGSHVEGFGVERA